MPKEESGLRVQGLELRESKEGKKKVQGLGSGRAGWLLPCAALRAWGVTSIDRRGEDGANDGQASRHLFAAQLPQLPPWFRVRGSGFWGVLGMVFPHCTTRAVPSDSRRFRESLGEWQGFGLRGVECGVWGVGCRGSDLGLGSSASGFGQ